MRVLGVGGGGSGRLEFAVVASGEFEAAMDRERQAHPTKNHDASLAHVVVVVGSGSGSDSDSGSGSSSNSSRRRRRVDPSPTPSALKPAETNAKTYPRNGSMQTGPRCHTRGGL